MIRLASLLGLGSAFLVCSAQAAPSVLPPPPPAGAESPWNGDWVLSQTRNPAAIRDQAADGYRFHIGRDGAILWEIPSLHETVSGHLDGAEMTIRRPGADGMALAVKADGPQTLLYTVFRNEKPIGQGRMTLAEQNRVWVDISGPFGRPDLAGVVIYVRPGQGKR